MRYFLFSSKPRVPGQEDGSWRASRKLSIADVRDETAVAAVEELSRQGYDVHAMYVKEPPAPGSRRSRSRR